MILYHKHVLTASWSFIFYTKILPNYKCLLKKGFHLKITCIKSLNIEKHGLWVCFNVLKIKCSIYAWFQRI